MTRRGLSFVLIACCLPGRAQVSADLPPLLQLADGQAVRDPEQFERRREEIRALLCRHFIGTFPDTTPTLVASEMLEQRLHPDGSTRRRVRLTWSTPHRRSFEIRVWVPAAAGPRPVLLTQPRGYQLEWAEMALARGYVAVLYPGVDSHHREPEYPEYDSIWQSFRSEYPAATWCEMATKAWLASRALDHVLAKGSGYDVAAGQVGIIGFSRYGKQALIAAAFDRRITSVVARSPGSPGSSPYRFTSRDTCAEAPADFPGEWFLPSLRGYTGREHELPIDAHGWYALIAPRHCLVDTALHDGSEPTFAVERAHLAGLEVYRLLGAPDHLRVLYRAGQHGPITRQQREANLAWFEHSFGRVPDPERFATELIHAFSWPEWRAAQPASALVAPERAHDDASRRQAIAWLLGEQPAKIDDLGGPELITPGESAMMTHDRWATAGVRRVPVRFGDGVRGNVYHREDLTAPAPVVVWLHPYWYHSGYNEGYGVQDTTVYHRLAREGFVVLAYDQCGFGLRLLEGRDFYRRYPHWSRLGRMVHDARAAVEFVTTGEGISAAPLPPLDPTRVALVGYALGGLVALHAAARDERVTAVAAHSGFTPFRGDDDRQPTGGIRRLWQWHALVPRLGLFHGREPQVPYDLEDVLALLGTRPSWIGAARRDRSIDAGAVAGAVRRAGSRAVTLHQPDDIQRFQRDQQARVVAWLRRVWRMDG